MGAEASFQLPLGATPQFPELFRAFDTKVDTLGVESYGVSVTTMEEVFLKVGDETRLLRI